MKLLSRAGLCTKTILSGGDASRILLSVQSVRTELKRASTSLFDPLPPLLERTVRVLLTCQAEQRESVAISDLQGRTLVLQSSIWLDYAWSGKVAASSRG